MNKNEIYFASAIVIDHYTGGSSWIPLVTRAYDFNLGDERKVGKRAAFARAQERVVERGKIQQVRRVEGPLFGQTMWLIQDASVTRGDHSGGEVRYDTRLLEPEPEPKPVEESTSLKDDDGDWWALAPNGKFYLVGWASRHVLSPSPETANINLEDFADHILDDGVTRSSDYVSPEVSTILIEIYL